MGSCEVAGQGPYGRIELIMIRFLILVGAVYALYRLIFSPPNVHFFSGGRAKPKTPRHPDAEEMVPCANCGTFIAKREADGRGGRFYCKPVCHQ